MNQKVQKLINLLNQKSTDIAVFQTMNNILFNNLNKIDNRTLLYLYNAIDNYNYNNLNLNSDLQNIVNTFCIEISEEYNKRIQILNFTYPNGVNNIDVPILFNEHANANQHTECILNDQFNQVPNNEKVPLTSQVEIHMDDKTINDKTIDNNKSSVFSIPAASTQYDKCISKSQQIIVCIIFFIAFIIGGIIFACIMIFKD